ncbi:hypothetical protein PAAG_12488 [Paracoccidioides lutzii Pb01]|uniref:Uncharacterized protein n=1 Tax=Paracoccidioides lutzii (strain ATCC MYA-826 / Pb01) TaxID=502779 RepID=A0A0A2UZZ9_PARBA|nr:hypothetical protein PAAG_12488 [Paracoccidioides lutzii Pb01]KGQ00823.1 hypothetical protein PAAG_12488 [Paracoccidioides lutzii Pb01]
MSSGYLAQLGGTIGNDYRVYQSQPEIERLISLLIRAFRDKDRTSDAAQLVDLRRQSPLKGRKPEISKCANIETQLTPILNIRRLEMMNGPLLKCVDVTKKPQGDSGPNHTKQRGSI